MKQYRVKSEYVYEWCYGQDMEECIVDDEEIERLARGWDRTVEELMEEVEEIEQ